MLPSAHRVILKETSILNRHQVWRQQYFSAVKPAILARLWVCLSSRRLRPCRAPKVVGKPWIGSLSTAGKITCVPVTKNRQAVQFVPGLGFSVKRSWEPPRPQRSPVRKVHKPLSVTFSDFPSLQTPTISSMHLGQASRRLSYLA